jgi:hypothetical protein
MTNSFKSIKISRIAEGKSLGFFLHPSLVLDMLFAKIWIFIITKKYKNKNHNYKSNSFFRKRIDIIREIFRQNVILDTNIENCGEVSHKKLPPPNET